MFNVVSLRPYQWFLLAVLLVCAIAIAIRYEVDFVVMYQASRLSHFDVFHVYGSRIGGITGGRFFYGPLTFFFIHPLAFFSFPVAKGIWIGLQTVAFVVFWAFLISNFGVLRRSHWAWLWVFAVSINPVHLNYQSNNIQLMILAVLMIAEVLSKRRETWCQYLGGILVALISAIKLYPFFIVVYFWIVKPRTVRIGLVLGLTLAAVIPLLQFGFADGVLLYKGFLNSLAGYHRDNSLIESFNLQCLPAVLARILPRQIAEGSQLAGSPWL